MRFPEVEYTRAEGGEGRGHRVGVDLEWRDSEFRMEALWISDFSGGNFLLTRTLNHTINAGIWNS